jgi:hypothetical protein
MNAADLDRITKRIRPVSLTAMGYERRSDHALPQLLIVNWEVETDIAKPRLVAVHLAGETHIRECAVFDLPTCAGAVDSLSCRQAYELGVHFGGYAAAMVMGQKVAVRHRVIEEAGPHGIN